MNEIINRIIEMKSKTLALLRGVAQQSGDGSNGDGDWKMA